MNLCENLSVVYGQVSVMALQRTFLRILRKSHLLRNAKYFCTKSPPTTHAKKFSGKMSSAYNNLNQEENADKKFSWFTRYGPEFHIRGEQVQIITEPRQFYEILKVKTKKAKRRVTLASLYLGTGQLEKDLVSSIDEACQAAAFSGSTDLEVNILLDFTRGSRGQVNSRTMLCPLLEKWPNMKVALYHTPDLRGWLKSVIPERFNETIGLTHIKLYLFDDSCIISGANLSTDYFTNRQDRYVLFNNCPQLADFFQNLVKSVMSFSLQLASDDSCHLAPDWHIHPFLASDQGLSFKLAARERIQSCLKSHMFSYDERDDQENEVFHLPETSTDTVIYPLIQMGPLGIQNDESATVDLFLRSEQPDLILLTSGYFNLTNQYADVIVDDADAKFKILMASPKANGFLGAKGIAGAVPYSYIYLAHQFYDKVVNAGHTHRIHMLEYEREGWTFHSKGLWYYLKSEHLPRLTLIGSPNFGFRSVYRDLECQVAIVTENASLQEQLRQEHVHLYTNSQTVTAETFQKTDRHVPLWTRLVTSIIKHFF